MSLSDSERLPEAIPPSALRLDPERRFDFLLEVSEMLGSSLDYQTTLSDLARFLVPRFATFCAIEIADRGGALAPMAIAHIDPGKIQDIHEIRHRYPPQERDTHGVAEVLRTGQPELYPTLPEPEPGGADPLRILRAIGIASAIVVPLSARGRTFGVIALGETREGLCFGPPDLKLAATIARQCAQALDRARLYDVERRSREQAAVLLEAGTLLASSLDPATTLRTLVRIATPTLGDLCTVDVVTEGGALCLVAVAHVDRTQEDVLCEMRRHLAITVNDTHPAAKAVRTGKPQVRSEAAEAHAEVATLDDEQLQVAVSLGARSAVFLPLLARGKVLGVLTLGQIDLRYAPGDIGFLQEFARRAALALDNARLYEAEQRARAQAEEASRVKDEFLAIVSHELRTPLNAILGWVRMLRSGAIKEGSVPRALETIERNAALQAQLVEDLMDASGFITGQMGLEFKDVRLQQVIEAAVNAMSAAAAAKGITIEGSLDHAVPPVRGDEGRLQQIARNLLSNAIKFSPRDKKVAIVLERSEAGAARLIVRDEGEGISPSFLPHAFDPFRQGDGTPTRRHGGLGLGLSIVRHLVEAHGGSVRAESEGPGKGATFTAELPLRPPSPTTVPTGPAHLTKLVPPTQLTAALAGLIDVEASWYSENEETH